jgi:glutaredoxin-related protein
LIGGLDILKETAAEGSLKEQWEIDDSASSLTKKETLQSRLEKLVKRHNVMLFMKGLPSAPRCGFSRQIVEILDDAGVSYDAFNILEDEEVRQGLKEFSGTCKSHCNAFVKITVAFCTVIGTRSRQRKLIATCFVKIGLLTHSCM